MRGNDVETIDTSSKTWMNFSPKLLVLEIDQELVGYPIQSPRRTMSPINDLSENFAPLF